MEPSSRACPRVGGPPSAGYDGKIAGLYDLEATLGRGHFAVVKLARHVFTGEKVAVKVIDKSKLDSVSKAHLFQEVRCMKLVQHPNVVRLYEVIDTQTKLYLVLELGDGGDLYDYIMRHEAGLSEPLAQKYFSQIVRAISYCHRLHVVHRDLKPENVVFFERLGVVKLTDFGFSNKFCPGQKLETSCGSLAYSAPEILLGDSYDAPAVDVWSLGVILFMLVAGQAPFQEANDSETLTMIMDCKYSVPTHVSTECKRLIGRMLVRDPERRARLDEIASDPWVRGGCPPGGEDLSLPLVSCRTLSEGDHAAIVQRMVAGNICTKEEIIESLEKNEYNYITATYYLLAERKLRSLDPVQTTPKGTPNKPIAPTLKVDSCNDNDLNSTPTIMSIANKGPGGQEINPRTRKCSIVTEDDEEEGCGGGGGSRRESGGGMNRRGSRSEGKLHLAVQEQLHTSAALQINSITEASTAPGPLHPSTDNNTPGRPVKTLPSALSTPPQSAGSNNNLNSVLTSPQMSVSSTISRYERRGKLRKGSTASCSSSDASDEDSEGRNKRKGSSSSLHRGRGPGDPRSGGGGGGTGQPPPGPPSGPPPQNGQGGLPPSNRGGSRRGEGGPGGGGGGGGSTERGGSVRSGEPGSRRRGETRLRESQSLNRITEVQEVESAAAAAATATAAATAAAGGTASAATVAAGGTASATTVAADGTASATVAGCGTASATVASGCGTASATTAPSTPPSQKEPPPPSLHQPLPLTSSLHSAKEQQSNKSQGGGGGGSSGSKRNALLGRYLMLQRKLCLPLLGGGGGRKRQALYKTSGTPDRQQQGQQDINSNLGTAAPATTTAATAAQVCQLHSQQQGNCCSLC